MCTYFSGFEKDPSTSKFEIYAKVDRLALLGTYKIRGNVIILPVVGNGASNMTFGMIFLTKYGKLKMDPENSPENGPENQKKIIFILLFFRQCRCFYQTPTQNRSQEGQNIFEFRWCKAWFYYNKVIFKKHFSKLHWQKLSHVLRSLSECTLIWKTCLTATDCWVSRQIGFWTKIGRISWMSWCRCWKRRLGILLMAFLVPYSPNSRMINCFYRSFFFKRKKNYV